MTPDDAPHPVPIVLVLSLAGLLAGCGAVDGEGRRFQRLAEHVAAIDVPLDPAAERPAPPRLAREAGLRPAKLEVAVMDPHDMWDARDAQAAGLRVRAADLARPVVEAAAPAVARAALDQAAARVPMLHHAVARDADGLRPATVERRMIQLGAFSSEAGARDAWTRLKDLAALAEAAPVFQPVEVDGRALTRLKVAVPADAAAAVCQAARVADPWCQRAG